MHGIAWIRTGRDQAIETGQADAAACQLAQEVVRGQVQDAADDGAQFTLRTQQGHGEDDAGGGTVFALQQVRNDKRGAAQDFLEVVAVADRHLDAIRNRRAERECAVGPCHEDRVELLWYVDGVGGKLALSGGGCVEHRRQVVGEPSQHDCA